MNEEIDDYAERVKFYRGLFGAQKAKSTDRVKARKTRKPRLKEPDWSDTVSTEELDDEYKDWISESGASPDAAAYFEKTFGSQIRLNYRAAMEEWQNLRQLSTLKKPNNRNQIK